MRQLHQCRVWAVVIAGAVVCVHVAVIAAPQQTVSSELRMLMAGGREPIEPTPGPPPADFPQEVLPRGTTPVASGVSGSRMVVVGTLANRMPGWRADYLSQVTALGWVSQMPAQSGFVMASQAEGASICKGTDFADVSLIPARSGGINVRATVTRDPRRVCASRGVGATMSFADVTFPTLEAPDGAKMSTGGSGGSSDDWSSHAKMTTELSIQALADHYRRQIIDAGWVEDGAPAFFDNAMVIRFKAPSKIGPPLPAMFIITAFDQPRQLDVFIRLTRPSDR